LEKEKLIIKNFGPIKEVELDLGRVTVLIGEQATGKSTIAKVLAVCRYFSYIVGEKGGELANYHVPTFLKGLKMWGIDKFVNDDSIIEYECSDYSLNVRNRDSELESNYNENVVQSIRTSFQVQLQPKSVKFGNLLLELNTIRPVSSNILWSIPTSFYINEVKNVMDNPFYLPTERCLQSIFSLGQGSIPNLANFLFNYFSKVDGILGDFLTETEIEPLDLIYINRNGSGYVRKKEDKDLYLLANAASGYQAIIPIVLVMKYYNETQNRSKTFIVEEPELNLFPTAQNKLMQHFVEQINKYGNSLLMTTHSPYTLTSLNNLMYAYTIGQSHPDEVNKVIDKKYWINPDDVSAYMLKADGTAESIIDEEEKMIVAEKIDGVSKIINKEFDELMNIELGIDAENN
jgi:predicted ATPase